MRNYIDRIERSEIRSVLKRVIGGESHSRFLERSPGEGALELVRCLVHQIVVEMFGGTEPRQRVTSVIRVRSSEESVRCS